MNADKVRSLREDGLVIYFLPISEGIYVGQRVFTKKEDGELMELAVLSKQDTLGGITAYVIGDIARITVTPRIVPPPKTLEEFMASEGWTAALELLQQKKRFITLAESEVVMSRASSVSLDGEGFKLATGIVGLAALYAKDGSTIKHLISPTEIIEEFRNCDPSLSESTILEGLLRILKEISLEPA